MCTGNQSALLILPNGDVTKHVKKDTLWIQVK